MGRRHDSALLLRFALAPVGRPFGDGLRYAGAPRSSLAWPGGAPVVVRIPVEKQRGKMRKSVKRKPGLDSTADKSGDRILDFWRDGFLAVQAVGSGVLPDL